MKISQRESNNLEYPKLLSGNPEAFSDNEKKTSTTKRKALGAFFFVASSAVIGYVLYPNTNEDSSQILL